MRILEMIVMTKSSKYGAYCIAGFDVSDGRWIRLVSEDEMTHGALDDQMLLDRVAGREVGVLDRIRAEVEEASFSAVQTENVLVRGTGRIRILERVSLEAALKLHPPEEREALFFSHRHIVEKDIGEIHHSLEFVKVRNLHIYAMKGASGKAKYKADFECGGRQYSMFAMTDPEYYEKRERWIDDAALALSVSDDEWSRANGHYIYVARIFDLESCAKNRRKRMIGCKQIVWIAGAILAAALTAGIGLALMSMDRVYVPGHTGARYHITERCERLNNPQAARQVISVIGKLLWKPCEECALEEKGEES